MNSFFDNKKVLITGAGGFVGKNVLEQIRKISSSVILFIPSRKELDLTKELEVKKYFEENKPEIVIHLAGKVGGIGINKQKPAEFFYENIMMGTLVTHYAYLNGCKKMVSLAAGCGYPKLLEAPYSEQDFWKDLPDENSIGYSMAKKNLVIQSWTYRQQYNFNSVVLLPANLYGPHDNFDLETSHVVPALIRKFIEAKRDKKEQIIVWGTGAASREFLFSKDTAKAILDMVEKVDDSGPYNLGTGKETTIKELIEIISEEVDYRGKIVWDSSKPDGQPRRFYNMEKFKNALGYVPSTNLRDGIKDTIQWYLKNEK